MEEEEEGRGGELDRAIGQRGRGNISSNDILLLRTCSKHGLLIINTMLEDFTYLRSAISSHGYPQEN